MSVCLCYCVIFYTLMFKINCFQHWKTYDININIFYCLTSNSLHLSSKNWQHCTHAARRCWSYRNGNNGKRAAGCDSSDNRTDTCPTSIATSRDILWWTHSRPVWQQSELPTKGSVPDPRPRKNSKPRWALHDFQNCLSLTRGASPSRWKVSCTYNFSVIWDTFFLFIQLSHSRRIAPSCWGHHQAVSTISPDPSNGWSCRRGIVVILLNAGKLICRESILFFSIQLTEHRKISLLLSMRYW